MKNDTVVIRHQPVITTIPLVKPSMSKTLVYRTNKEFDKCAELLRNILSVQESRRNVKSKTMPETKSKKQKQTSINTRSKKQNNKINIPKSPCIKTKTIQRRSSYSPNKILPSTIGEIKEEPLLSKNYISPNKSRKYITRSPSPLKTNKSRQKSSKLSIHHHHIGNKEKLIRSSSCGDLSHLKSNLMNKNKIFDQFIKHLTRIRIISKQIRTRNLNTIHNSDCNHLWNELESSLSSILLYANNDKEFQLSLIPLQNEILELRKQLQTINIHLCKYDLTHHNNEQYVENIQKKFDTNQIQCTQLLLHNKELKTKCHLLQDKLDHLERNNIHLIQRLTQQDLRSITQYTEWISTDNRFLLHKEIIFLQDKLYHIYDDLDTLFNRNHTLQISIEEQKKQLLSYKQQFKILKHSAQHLLHDIDNQLIEEKLKEFLNNILHDQHNSEISKKPFHQTYITPTKSASSNVNLSSFVFQTFHKSTNQFRPKSLFITPTILNDSNILSKFQNNQKTKINITHYLSSTIDDADSTLTSSSSTSLYYQQRKYNNLYNSLPSLIVPITNDKTTTVNQQIHNNESSVEFDHISNLSSKIFSSGDEDDINISTSLSSTTLSHIE